MKVPKVMKGYSLGAMKSNEMKASQIIESPMIDNTNDLPI
jgi:hypothetical protein